MTENRGCSATKNLARKTKGSFKVPDSILAFSNPFRESQSSFEMVTGAFITKSFRVVGKYMRKDKLLSGLTLERGIFR